MYVNISNHPESYLTASTLSNMLIKVKSTGSEYFAVTDNGTLVSALKTYYAAKEKGLKPIIGIELFFKDDNCEIINGTPLEQAKYFKLLMYFKDQPAYQEMVRMISKSDRKKVKIGEDSEYPIFNWADLEHLSKFNVAVSTSNIEDMVSKHTLFNRADLSKKYYSKLLTIFGDNYTPAICTFEHTHYQDRLIEVTLSGNYKIQLPLNTRIITDSKAFKNTANDLYKFQKRHKKLFTVYYNGLKSNIKKENQDILKVEMVKAFVPFPQGDIQKTANRVIMAIHKGRLLLNDSAYYVDKDDKIVQNMKLGEGGRFLHQNLYIKTPAETALYLKGLGLEADKIKELFSNTVEWARGFDGFELKYEYKLADTSGNNKERLIEKIKATGRMKWDDPKYVSQMEDEIKTLTENGVLDLIPYFFPLDGVFEDYKKNGHLTGPGRGSSAGFLLAYLLGVTHVDPIKEKLSSSRFITAGRIRMGSIPDVDVDLPQRTTLVGHDGNSGYLGRVYGDKFCQISTRTLCKLKSSILDANRFFKGSVEPEIAALSKKLPAPPQGMPDRDFVFGYKTPEGVEMPGLLETNKDLREYSETRPDEWGLVVKNLSISRQISRHASAFLISNSPISDTVPTFEIGGVKRVCQPEAKETEYAGLIKYDFLVITALQWIEDCLKGVNKKNQSDYEIGHFDHNGEKIFVWDLPNDPAVWDMLAQGHTETVFQLNTPSVTPTVMRANPRCIQDGAVVTSLERPGPKDYIDPRTNRNMVQEYIARKDGESVGDIEELNRLLPDTLGVICYQEDVTLIAREIGKMDMEQSENLRIGMGKKKVKIVEQLKPVFLKGAIENVGEEKANKIWSMMETFARYGFCKAHAISYIYVSYSCAFLKYHYPLEWWASVLTHAESKEINEVFYKYVRDILLPPDINLSKEDITIDYENKKLRQKLSAISGLGGKVAEKIVSLRPFKDLKDFVKKKPCGPSMTRKLIYIGALDSLMPVEANTMLKKMWAYEESVKQVEHEAKLKDLKALPASEVNSKKIEKLEAKGRSKAKIDPYYMVIDPLKDYLIKKEICPTINLDLYDLIKKYAKKVPILPRGGKSMAIDNYGNEVYLGGPTLLEKMDGETTNRDVCFCVPGYVVDASEFSYAKNTKKAYKMVIDSSGYISEKVIWADYNTGELKYPESLKKGCLAFFFYKKRAEKDMINIYHVVVEVEGIKEDT
jgi:DNA polymerase III alpha subunit